MNVFISHSFADAPLAKRVSENLKAHGFQVWDEKLMMSGDNWAKVHSLALEKSDAMVVLLTPNFVNSPNLATDLEHALGQKKYKGRLIPVMAAPADQFNPGDIPWILNHKPLQMLHAPDLDTSESDLRQIVSALELVIKQPISRV